MFLVKINLPPFYSLLLLLFIHAFLPYAPISPPHFPPSLPPLSFPLFLIPQPYSLYTPKQSGEGGGEGFRWMRKKKFFRGDREIRLALVLCCNGSFECMHLEVSAGKLPHVTVEVWIKSYLYAACRFRFVCQSQGGNFTEVQSFIPSLYLSRWE